MKKKKRNDELKPKEGYSTWSKRTKGGIRKKKVLETALLHLKNKRQADIIQDKLEEE